MHLGQRIEQDLQALAAKGLHAHRASRGPVGMWSFGVLSSYGMAQAWFRNPSNYVRELQATGENKFIFDYGWMIRRGVRPVEWARLHYGNQPFRMLTCGGQGTAEFGPGDIAPRAVYPTWQYGEDTSMLETYMALPWGRDKELCDLEAPELERPVFGQENRVIVANFPSLAEGPGVKLLQLLSELQEEYPDCIVHLHGGTLFTTGIRTGLRAVDFDPRTAAAHGTIYLPGGKPLKSQDEILLASDWLKVLGARPSEMKDPRNRCKVNIKAAAWAAENFTTDLRIATVNKDVDPSIPDADYDPVENNRIMFRKVRSQPGDKYVCNSCSLAMACKFYREGSVCSVPMSEPRELTKFFGTRNAETIIDGLLEVTKMNAQRLQTAVEREEEKNELDPKVTRLTQVLSDQGRKLAMIMDPSMRKPGVQINVGQGGNAQVAMIDPKQVIASALRQLEIQGIPRDKVTPEMLQAILGGTPPPAPEPSPMKVIEGKVVNSGAPVDTDLPF